MPTYVEYACCAVKYAPARLVAKSEDEAPAWYGPPVKEFEIPDYAPVDPKVAYHEAGHCVVGLALPGFDVGNMHVVGQGLAEVAATDATRAIDIVAMLQAGHIAGRWSHHHIQHASDTELLSSLHRGAVGGCDRCQELRLCRRIVGDKATDEGVVLIWQTIQAATLKFVRMPPVWPAIRELAEHAIAHRGATAEAVHEIARKHFEPGSFRIEL